MQLAIAAILPSSMHLHLHLNIAQLRTGADHDWVNADKRL